MRNALKLSTHKTSKLQVAVVAAFCTKKQWLIAPRLSFLCLFFQLFLMQCVALSCKLDNINSTPSCNYFYQQVILISKG